MERLGMEALGARVQVTAQEAVVTLHLSVDSSDKVLFEFGRY
jgi:hypothetical protein